MTLPDAVPSTSTEDTDAIPVPNLLCPKCAPGRIIKFGVPDPFRVIAIGYLPDTNRWLMACEQCGGVGTVPTTYDHVPFGPR